jgi:hypothetical protein
LYVPMKMAVRLGKPKAQNMPKNTWKGKKIENWTLR